MISLLAKSGEDSLSEINQFLFNGFEGFLILEGEHEDDAVDKLVELEWQFGEGSDVCVGVCGTVLILKYNFVFAAVEVEYGCLLALQHEVVVIYEFVFSEASDEVGLAYALLALSR